MITGSEDQYDSTRVKDRYHYPVIADTGPWESLLFFLPLKLDDKCSFGAIDCPRREIIEAVGVFQNTMRGL